jgi:proteic killer suppression protein
VIVDILFASENLERLCHDDAFARRALGHVCAQKLRTRLDDLRAAVNLSYARQLPGRFHPLQVDSQPYFAVHLDADHRLVLAPVGKSNLNPKEESWDLSEITVVRVMEVRST